MACFNVSFVSMRLYGACTELLGVPLQPRSLEELAVKFVNILNWVWEGQRWMCLGTRPMYCERPLWFLLLLCFLVLNPPSPLLNPLECVCINFFSHFASLFFLLLT